MNVDRLITVNSEGSNPAEFTVKLPQTLSIQPNSEIAMVKSRVNTRSLVNIDDTNDTLILLWGAYNGEVLAGANLVKSLKPEVIKLTHGEWREVVKNPAAKSAGGLLTPPRIVNNTRNLLTNLVGALNEQSIHKVWGWVGEWTTTTQCYIAPYLKDFVNNSIQFKGWIGNEGSPVFTDVPAVGGVSPQITDIDNNAANDGGFGSVSVYNVPFPFDDRIKTAAADFETSLAVWNLDNAGGALPADSKVFGGFIFEEQETYKKSLGQYDRNKDWIVAEKAELGTGLEINANNAEVFPQMPIYWFADNEGNLKVRQMAINQNGMPSTTNIAQEIDLGAVYNGTAVKEIRATAQMKAVGGETRMVIRWSLDGVFVAEMNIPRDIVSRKIRVANWWKAKNGNAIQFSGVDNKCFLVETPLNAKGSLGSIDGPPVVNIGNWFATLIFTPFSVREEIVLGGIAWRLSQEVLALSQEANCVAGLLEQQNYLIFNRTTTLIANQVTIEWVSDLNDQLIFINIDNLPLNNFSGLKNNGNLTNAIHAILGKNNQTIDDDPNSMIYTPLINKQPYPVNNLRIRLTDITGRTIGGIVGTTTIQLHLRTNPTGLMRELVSAVRSQTQKLETQDNSNVEEAFRLYQKVI